MDLHSQWQQLILQNLSEAFPSRLSLIVTTLPSSALCHEINKIRVLPDFATDEGEALSPIGGTLGTLTNTTNVKLDQKIGFWNPQ